MPKSEKHAKFEEVYAWILLAVFLALFVLALLRSFGITHGKPVDFFTWILIVIGLAADIYHLVTRRRSSSASS